ncbi:HemK2/MTQ2 family protein methyltransferase [Streptomyces spectabilis]|uniref:HemK2/MTQ2 family protein methyltransferase n=1 Tax=Streptomyces spectabilis TaxID=68270 RepID=UPI0033C38083
MTTRVRTATQGWPRTSPRARPVRLLTPPGVYAPQCDTELLLRALYREDLRTAAPVLDLGTGSGALALAAARLGADVTALDISWKAVLTARINAFRAGQPVTVRRRDMTARIPPGPYDLVVSNPPYVPSLSSLPPRRGAARAWDGGPDGRALVNRVCDVSARALRAGGALLIVHSALCGVAATLARLTDLGMDAQVTDREIVPFGPVLRSRRAWLRHRDLLGEDETCEELVVIRAERR